MEREFVHDLAGPHWDVEWNCLRGSIRYWITLPAGGVDQQTGLVVLIHGYGQSGDDEYARKFRAFISDRFNCGVVTLRYYGSSSYANVSLRPAPDFFLKLKEHHGITVGRSENLSSNQIIGGTMSALMQRGIERLHVECILLTETDEYHSFGVLPAIDTLTVVNDVLHRYPLDKKRLFAIGSSYGGFIVEMILKLAPNTFRMLIDNSGFTSADEDQTGLYGAGLTRISGVGIATLATRRWSADPASPYYFSKSCRDIRNMLNPEHVGKSETQLYCYHSARDTLIPAAHKRALTDIYRGKVPYEQTMVEETDIDGHLFKTLEHGMQASLRGLFEASYDRYSAGAKVAMDTTDFELKSQIVLPCSERTYVAYYDEKGVELVIQ